MIFLVLFSIFTLIFLSNATNTTFSECSCESLSIIDDVRTPIVGRQLRNAGGDLDNAFQDIKGAIDLFDQAYCSADQKCNINSADGKDDFEFRCVLFETKYYNDPAKAMSEPDEVYEYRNCALVKKSVVADKCYEAHETNNVFTGCFCNSGDLCNANVSVAAPTPAPTEAPGPVEVEPVVPDVNNAPDTNGFVSDEGAKTDKDSKKATNVTEGQGGSGGNMIFVKGIVKFLVLLPIFSFNLL